MTENTVQLLWGCAQALESETHASKLLKSYYTNTCRKIIGNKEEMPKINFGASQMCAHCALFWSENQFQLKLLTTNIRKNSKTKTQLAYLDMEKDAQNKVLQTKKQRKRAKWLKKKMDSQIQILCEFCKHKSYVKLQKPAVKSKLEAIATQPEIVESTKMEITEKFPAKSKKKKKHSKDKTAGLKIDRKSKVTTKSNEMATNLKPTHSNNQPSTMLPTQKVSAMQPTLLSKKQAAPIQQLLPTKHEGTSATQPTSKKDATALKTKTETVPNKSTSVGLRQPLKAQMKKKKKPKPKTLQQTSHTTSVKPKTTKNQSLTQQNNALLQLASLLKKQGNKTTTNTAQSRLDALLK